MDNEHTNLEINAVICGMTSVGKSTFLNALCKRQYAETGIKPTTMEPHLYSSRKKGVLEAAFFLSRLLTPKLLTAIIFENLDIFSSFIIV